MASARLAAQTAGGITIAELIGELDCAERSPPC
jgi:hypothetical protein